MQKDEVQKVLDRFRDHVISVSKRNLTNSQKNSSKKLYNSIKGEVKAMPNSISIQFSMEDYGIYQDAAGLGDSSGPYLVGVLEGYYRPNNAYAGMMNELYEMIDNDANYDDLDVILSSSGNSSQTTATNQDYENAYMKE